MAVPVIGCEPGNPAAAGLQACLDAAPGGSTIDLAPGSYVIDRQVVIRKPVTLRARPAGNVEPDCRVDAARCASLVASPDVADEGGLLVLASTSDVTLQHIVIDGNRAGRTSSAASAACAAGRNRSGFNAAALDCVRCTLDNIVSMNALCGTAFEWTGSHALIQHSLFRDNGDASTTRLWADGLTLLHAPHSLVTDNLFVDNSDVALILGHGAYTQVSRNQIVQRRQHAFAALMLDNFNSGDLETRGDFTGAVVIANDIDCGRFMCGFGIDLGPHAWYDSRSIVGGEVIGNRIAGAGVGIVADGAGTRRSPIAVYGNTILQVPDTTTFRLCGAMFETSAIDIAKDAFVNRRGDDRYPARQRDWHACQ
jgi:hypothetical protein